MHNQAVLALQSTCEVREQVQRQSLAPPSPPSPLVHEGYGAKLLVFVFPFLSSAIQFV